MINVDEIELKTRDILEQVLGNIFSIKPPINLGKVLEFYGLKLAMAMFKDANIAGAFDKSERTIVLSEQDPPKRQFFTAAHEVGHFILHPKKKVDVFYRQQLSEFNGESSADEKEANYFAASLLMPAELVEQFWKTHHDIELLAAYFGVSRSAAFWRLKHLKLI